MKYILVFFYIYASFFSLNAAGILTIFSKTSQHIFIIDIVDTKKKREKGLMYHQSLPSHKGMVFLYEKPAQQCFWMKNTFIPLDILMVNQQNIIVEVLRSMQPHSLKKRCSQYQVQMAIELKAGVSQRKGIKVGDRVVIDYG